MTPLVFSACDIATLMTGPGGQILTPTPEQQAVIEAEPQGTVLVVAGAGSGKTETIATRVVWLVANGFASPGAVLGLTFTRKAAGELAARVRGRLVTFVERAREATLTSPQRARIDELDALMHQAMELPEVSTYNAYASSLVQEFGSPVGIGGQLIDDAVAWGIARDVVVRSADERLSRTGLGIARLTELTLSMAHAVTDHLSTFDEARNAIHAFEKVAELPYDSKELSSGQRSGKRYKDITEQLKDFEKTLAVIDLAEEYARVKRELGVLEFSDQISLAREALSKTPDADALLRRRYQAVVLDEVQDTSVAQTTLLSELFAGSHVMAVGDPHQSIYGWRGASTESLSGFHRAFQGSAHTPQLTLTLSTSWRNSQQVLAAANRAAQPLRDASAIPVPVLNASPTAAEGTVDVDYFETLTEEAAAVAQWMRTQREQYASSHQGEPPTAAVIFRKRKHMSLFASALAEQNVPAHIVGIGGLLSTPEVQDLVSLLRCVWFADASNDLIRILAGPRFAIGPADIAGLRTLARWFAGRDVAHTTIDETEYATREFESLDRHVSLVDAVDLVATLTPGHRALASISDVGQRRLRDVALMLRRLRQLVYGDVIDLIRVAVRELMLDLELESREHLRESSIATAKENITSLTEAVRAFLTVSPERSLRAVLEWLEHAEREDELPAYVPPPEPGTVQLITVHSAKGLEWDLVAIPRQSASEFPSSPKTTRGEFSAGVIPDRCRGDAASRPVCAWADAETQKEVLEAIAEYKREQASMLLSEELRLIYVAYTRAKRNMYLTGSFWGTTQRQQAPAAPLRALQADYVPPYTRGHLPEHALIDPLPTKSEHSEKPETGPAHTLVWPLDPLGTRRARVTAAANAISEHHDADVTPDPLAELLIALEEDTAEPQSPSGMFPRINASAFHEIVRDPEHAALQALRPVPRRPFRKTRLGNLFHDWVERRTTTAVGTALTLEMAEIDDGQLSAPEREQLQRLIDTFERSRWAGLKPIMVEQEFTIPFAGRRLVCKLDAVYEIEGRTEIVDWKTGRTPETKAEELDRLLQLDLYRVAYAMATGSDPSTIDVVLYYVEADFELRSSRSRSFSELEALWAEAEQRMGSASAMWA